MSSASQLFGGRAITDDDAAIAAAPEDVSIPVLMCSMVHLTGDPSWIRSEIKPAGFYCYSFEPADHWTEYFSQQPELHQYFVNVTHTYGIDADCRFNTEVTAATWNDQAAQWIVECRSGDGSISTVEARAVISAVGALSRPKLPDIPGMDDFAGASFHTARWDQSVSITTILTSAKRG
jgi:hypothetical protein